jgi:hypothetical protein
MLRTLSERVLTDLARQGGHRMMILGQIEQRLFNGPDRDHLRIKDAFNLVRFAKAAWSQAVTLQKLAIDEC